MRDGVAGDQTAAIEECWYSLRGHRQCWFGGNQVVGLIGENIEAVVGACQCDLHLDGGGLWINLYTSDIHIPVAHARKTGFATLIATDTTDKQRVHAQARQMPGNI